MPWNTRNGNKLKYKTQGEKRNTKKTISSVKRKMQRASQRWMVDGTKNSSFFYLPYLRLDSPRRCPGGLEEEERIFIFCVYNLSNFHPRVFAVKLLAKFWYSVGNKKNKNIRW